MDGDGCVKRALEGTYKTKIRIKKRTFLYYICDLCEERCTGQYRIPFLAFAPAPNVSAEVKAR